MARAENTEVIDKFEQFYRDYYRNEIGELAQKYPNEQRSLYIDWDDLYRFDPDLADDFIAQPEQMRDYAEEALRLYDLPVDVKLGQAHVRLKNLQDTTGIRDIRARHRGQLVEVTGIVRKATDVRPKITEAAFECQRCGTLTRIPQTSGEFHEPHECQGCERQGPFDINFDQSEFVDAQKLRVQESPEGLRGGETPQSIDVHIEDDVTGRVTAGDHVRVAGILHLDQQQTNQEKSPIFDVYMDGLSVEIEDEQFEDMDITEEDKKEIIELSNESEIYEKMVASMAPSIYGYDQQKLAIIMQLFSGVTKHLPDGSRTRGDLHMLLIGDPGTGKCVHGDTRVTLGDGREVEIRDLVESNLDDPKPVDDGVYDEVEFEVPSMTHDGALTQRRVTKVWKREAPEQMYRIQTASGKQLEVTPSHPLFVNAARGPQARKAERLENGDAVAAVDSADQDGLTADGGTAVGATPGSSPVHTDGDISWDKIESIETITPDYNWVYDLEVEGTHSYVSNDVISHNSQLLQYVRNLAPRSVYTSGKGSSSAGLCVTGDTMIHTGDGFRSIQDIVTPELPDPVTTETAVESAVDVQTFDQNMGEMTDSVSSHVWRMPEKPCCRIETNYGKELEASVNTPVLVCGTDGIEWREISEVQQGDYIAAPRYDSVDRSEVPVREFLELSTEKIRLSNESIAFLRESLQEVFGTLRDAAAALELSEDFIYLHLKNRHVPLEKLDRMLDAVGATRDDIEFDRLMIRHGDSITVPKCFDEELMYLLGLVFGDGDISLDRRDGNRGMVRLSNGDKTLLERAADIFEAKFDKRPRIEYQDDRVPCIRVNSATIARLFSNVGMQSPKDDLSLAPALTVAEHADAFLRGLMDADGSVSSRDTGGSSVLMSTISKNLARQVQLILETYGVRASVRERDRRGTYELDDGRTIESKRTQHFVEMYGADIDRYADVIGFECADKQQALERIVSEERRQRELIPVGAALETVEGTAGGYYHNIHRGDNPGRERARAMLEETDLGPVEPDVREVVDADLRWEEVVATIDTGRKEVYDLTIPDTHNFVGNGVITHNTAAAVRDDFGDGQQWTLEAGALVLADQGIAAVDELDKMRCVTGDTLVHLADGRITRISALAREAESDGRIEELSNGRTIRDVDVDAWTMTDEGQLVERPVTAIHEYDAPTELTEVTLESGESLTATDDHPFFVFEDGQRIERSAADLQQGDWVYVPKDLTPSVTDGGAVSTTARTEISESKMPPAMGAVLGYLSGDGNVYYNRQEGSYGIRFTNKEEQLLSDFERACREAFDAEPVRHPSEQRDDGVETVRLHGREYADAVIEAGMNLETYDDKSFPDGVSKGARPTKAAFVCAMADSEGTVDTASNNVRINSASRELLQGLKSILLEFGVSCQVRTRKRPEKRDLHVLSITSADSLRAYNRHIGFTLDRKQGALDAVCGAVDGNRTIVDVLPGGGEILQELRESLRLHQSECGLEDATYCNFENDDANISLDRAELVLTAFKTRVERATKDVEKLSEASDWSQLAELKDQYNIPQRELAEGTNFSQQQISRGWGESKAIRTVVQTRLTAIIEGVANTDVSPLRELVNGDVKWRRISEVENSTDTWDDDRVPLLRMELADVLGCDAANAVQRAKELLTAEPETDSWTALGDELERYSIPLQRIADDLDVAGSTVSRWFRGVVESDRFDEVRDAAQSRISEKRRRIHSLVQEMESRRESKVYDLTVEGTHNFVANGMVVHNSEDRSAMHEALEQQSISVSKAGINATLKSRCSLLGAANPKYGRFDQYEPIGEQIDLEPALISRFDLIFTVTDQPDEKEDAKLAEHIINTNYAGELFTHRENTATSNVTEEEVENVTEDVEPEIDAELLRKYIAYAKRNCYPTMTEEAKKEIRDFYVDLRAKGQDEDAPVPVTARKLEALVRLSEASARMRLSDTVEIEDAKRVIDIVRSCLQDIGVDPETGEFDADVVETGTSKSQRDRIKDIKSLISEIEEEYEEGAPIEEVLDRAEEMGTERSKAEHEIEKLRQKGDVYEPKTDHLRTV